MKAILSTVALFHICLFLFGQCEIWGEEELICPQGEYYYTLFDSCSAETWWIDPPFEAQIVTSDDSQAGVIFYTSGEFILYAMVTYAGPNGQVIHDTVDFEIFVEMGDPIEVEVSGCTDFEAGCYRVCQGSQVSLLYESFEGEILIEGASEFEYLSNGVVITWGEVGEGSVDFFDFCGNERFCFTVMPPAEADFQQLDNPGVDTIVVCAEELVYFENLSSGGLGYSWDFGDGTTGESFDGSHGYTDAGFYEVVLRASGVCDCGSSDTLVVEVIEDIAPTLTCVATVCPESRELYTAISDGCTSFDWEISSNGTIIQGGGFEDDFVEIIWHEGPEGIISLLVSDCNSSACPRPVTFRIPIIEQSGPIDGEEHVCAGELETYEAPFWETTEYVWSISGHGTIISQDLNTLKVLWDDVNQTVTATIDVQYSSCYLGCGGEDQFEVSITPHFEVVAPRRVCEGETWIARGVTSGWPVSEVPLHWRIEDEEGVEVFAEANQSVITVLGSLAPGLHTLVAWSEDGDVCNNEYRHVFFVSALPDAPLGVNGPKEICPQSLTQFEVASAGDFGTRWTVRDGAEVYEYVGELMSHEFGENLPYTLEVQHFDLVDTGCSSDLLVVQLDVLQIGEIQGVDTVCIDELEYYSIPFHGNEPIEWSLMPSDMGDIVQVSMDTIAIHWKAAGDAVLEANLCSQTASRSIHVRPLPEIELIGGLEVCPGSLTLISTDLPDQTHQWSTADGQYLTDDLSISLGEGHYRVRVQDRNGCWSERVFEVVGIPSAELSIAAPLSLPLCDDISDGITLEAVTDDVDAVVNWYREGLYVGTGLSHTTFLFGLFTIEAVGSNGCVTTSEEFYLYECCPGDPCFEQGVCNNPNGCPFLPEDFNIEESMPFCDQINMEMNDPNVIAGTTRWAVGDMENNILWVGSGDILSYEFDEVGYYRVVAGAQVMDFNYPGVACDHQEIMLVRVPLSTKYLYAPPCLGEAVQFEDKSTFLGGSEPVSWVWDFGDPASGAANSSLDPDPTHEFSGPGVYTVSLEVTAPEGCISTYSEDIEIRDEYAVIVDYNMEICEGGLSTFALHSNLFEVTWDFGDINSLAPGYGLETQHSYSDLGMYEVSLNALDSVGCAVDYSMQIEVFPNTLPADISIVPNDSICNDQLAELQAPDGGVLWEWNTMEDTEGIQVDSTGTYFVFFQDDIGCTQESNAQDIWVLPVPNAQVQGQMVAEGEYSPWLDSVEVCYGEEFLLEVFVDINSEVLWTTNHETNQVVFNKDGAGFLDVGIHEIGVVVTSVLGSCVSDTQYIQVEVHPLPSAPVIVWSSSPACEGQSNVVSVINPEPGLTYLWSDGQEGQSVQISEAGEYWVQAISPAGCATLSNSVSVIPGPQAQYIPSGCAEACGSLSICIPDAVNAQNFEIYRDGTLLMIAANLDNWVINQSGVYHMVLTSANGCQIATEPFDVTIHDVIGDIVVTTYFDQDGDGVISGADQLVDADVIVESITGGIRRQTKTIGGSFGFVDLPDEEYLVGFDLDSLDPGFVSLIDSQVVTLTDCGQIVEIELLLAMDCSYTDPDTITMHICEDELAILGDSTWSEPGLYTYVNSSGSCDTIQYVEVRESEMALEAVVMDSCLRRGSIDIATTGSGPFEYLWSPEVSNSSAASGLSHGLYSITVTDAFGCSQMIEVSIDSLADLSFDIEASFSGVQGDVIELPIQGDIDAPGLSVSWNPADLLDCDDCFDPLHSLEVNSQDYDILITDENGCNYTLSTQVIAVADETLVYVPNVFSPNADGKNDKFKVYSDGSFEVESVQVYNRWGELVYEEIQQMTPQMHGWDGRFRGKALNSDVYIWTVVGKTEFGNRLRLEGDVTLVR